MPFPDQVALFNMNDWKYNDTFARQQGAWPVPKQFSIVYSDGWWVVQPSKCLSWLACIPLL